MDKKKFLARYKEFFAQCTPPPSEENVSAIVKKALIELKKIKKALAEARDHNRKSPEEIQETAENFLQTKLSKMLGVCGPTPCGSGRRFIGSRRESKGKWKISCGLCKKIQGQKWKNASLCYGCGAFLRIFLTTYHEYLPFLHGLSEKERENAAWKARRIYVSLTEKTGPPKGKNAKILIIKTVIPLLKKWHEGKIAMNKKGDAVR